MCRSFVRIESAAARAAPTITASRAVKMQNRNGAVPRKHAAEWSKQAAMHAYSLAAVRFANGAAPGDNGYHEERFTRLLVEGETNASTTVGETFEEGAW
jgi:hypothetical protein